MSGRVGTPGGSRLVLASASPRRAALLAALGVAFTVRAVAVDETPLAGEAPEPYVRRLAGAKAAAAHATTTPGAPEVVLAADTTVALDGRILGKPAHPDEARAMLRTLSGRTHTVLTAVAARRTADAGTGARTEVSLAVARTEVTFAVLDEGAVEWYLGTGEPYDKAGGYGIQGAAGVFVEAIHGSCSNVVGLPLATTRSVLAAVGVDLLALGTRFPGP